MTYLIKDFAQLTGVSERTLRYYHEIGILIPERADNGYRKYTSRDADQLQLILMYRNLQFDLSTIKQLLALPVKQKIKELATQQSVLIKKQSELTQALQQIAITLANYREEQLMKDPEKFTVFKQAAITENQELFGKEVVSKYGSKQQRNANQHFKNLTTIQYQQMQTNEVQLIFELQQYIASPNLPSDLAQKIFNHHQAWLQLASPDYSLKMHRAIAEMYVSDARFTNYYTKLIGHPQAAKALNSIINYYAIK